MHLQLHLLVLCVPLMLADPLGSALKNAFCLYKSGQRVSFLLYKN